MKQNASIQTLPINKLKMVLSVKARKDFDNFMHGSTVLVRTDKQLGVYMWDFQMWLSHYNSKLTKLITK